MNDENVDIAHEKQTIKEAMDLLLMACDMLYELKSSEGRALAFFVDRALIYANVIYHDRNQDVESYLLNGRHKDGS